MESEGKELYVPEEIHTGVGTDLVAGRDFLHDSCDTVKYIHSLP